VTARRDGPSWRRNRTGASVDPVTSAAHTRATFVGRAWFGPWWLVYRGPVGPTAHHRHHAAQAVFGRGVRVEVDGAPRSSPVVVEANAPHRIIDGDDDATLLYVDGDAARGRTLVLPEATDHPAPENWSTAAQLVGAVCDVVVPRQPEPAAITAVRSLLADAERTHSVEELAVSVGLSPSRLSHVFSATVGIPIRSYRRWLRLVVAAEAIAQGAGLTDAAHAAGFADGAHLARTFRSHFGLSVRELTSGIVWSTS
jgi:AraC-like DNA-binding protein